MLVFIDDSGDAGFKLEKGSSHFFVIAAVIFQDNLEAEKTAVSIKEARRALGFSDKVEFKFNGSRKDVRIAFLEKVNRFSFFVRYLVVNKKIIHSEELRNNKNSFYSYMIKTLLKYSDKSIIDANIKIDGSGNRIFRKQFLEYLRKNLNSKDCKVLKNCKLVNSNGNVLIQMADMIAGAIRRSYEEEKTDSQLYKKIIQKHIKDEWNFK